MDSGSWEAQAGKRGLGAFSRIFLTQKSALMQSEMLNLVFFVGLFMEGEAMLTNGGCDEEQKQKGVIIISKFISRQVNRLVS